MATCLKIRRYERPKNTTVITHCFYNNTKQPLKGRTKKIWATGDTTQG